jgi:hypothetical protein
MPPGAISRIATYIYSAQTDILKQMRAFAP